MDNNNATGFSALPAGYNYSYSNNSPGSQGSYAYFWSSTESGSYAYRPYLYYYDSGFYTNNTDYKCYGFSVRCLRN